MGNRTTQTAEYKLLRDIAAGASKSQLNQVALTKAVDDGYVVSVLGVVWLTEDGLARLDQLED